HRIGVGSVRLPKTDVRPPGAADRRFQNPVGSAGMEPVKAVLFVCVENSNRSQMAEAFARMHGGPGVEAGSAGSRPSGRVNPRAVAAMKELGYDLTAHQSNSLAEVPDVEYDFVATMGCGDACPLVKAKRRED